MNERKVKMTKRVCGDCAYAKKIRHNGLMRYSCGVQGHRMLIGDIAKCPKGYTEQDMDDVDKLCANDSNLDLFIFPVSI